MAHPLVARWRRGLDRPGWRGFAIAMAALAIAMLLALYSGAAAEAGQLWLAGATALAALGLAGWVAITIVPALARRTPLRWFAYQINYKLTREGVVYLAWVCVVALAALNTGNNLLFLVLASLLAGIVVSGVASRIVLAGIELKLDLPEHIFAERPLMATVELHNEKQTLPSFSLRVVGEQGGSHAGILTRPVYFPYIPRQQSARQKVELVFPRRGVYREKAFGIRTKFPFGFLQKTLKVDSQMELVVYPHIEPTDEFFEVLPLVSGELESFARGRGHDLYSIRDYQPTDSARFVDWKASAKTGALKVREFAREDERRVMIVLDAFLDVRPGENGWSSPAEAEEKFERAVNLAACLAWHFYEVDSVLAFRSGDLTVPIAPASEIIYDVLRHLAFVQPLPPEAGRDFLSSLAAESNVFKIILTSQPRGSIPTSLWTSSYFLFIPSLLGRTRSERVPAGRSAG
ncbi:MAG TPA: DUF58 domain-containing protein [Candidatus Acidoferrales bacterium]|nr:DUF58 domain-containing protein [Candidatus Acidoferrales bacterium]